MILPMRDYQIQATSNQYLRMTDNTLFLCQRDSITGTEIGLRDVTGISYYEEIFRQEEQKTDDLIQNLTRQAGR